MGVEAIALVRNGEDQDPAVFHDLGHLGQPPHQVGDVLDHVRRHDPVEGGSGLRRLDEVTRLAVLNQMEVDLGDGIVRHVGIVGVVLEQTLPVQNVHVAHVAFVPQHHRPVEGPHLETVPDREVVQVPVELPARVQC